MTRNLINPPASQQDYDTFHFSQAVSAGGLVWVSGQVGLDPTTGLPADGMRAQATLAFEKIRTVLAAAGASMADIVDITSFHTDLRADIGDFMAVKDAFIAADFPAWTAVGVTELAYPGAVVEIKVVAVAGGAA
ncbi:RidA family protein [Millisia brevis]|uniref:RidA family protein n=1 Tax=Millisia brevis TaxID=264148 RepID=UPI00082BB2F4|nr:RidA family protein [Millisia brevis]